MRAEIRSAMWCMVAVVAAFTLLALPAAAQQNSHGDPAIHGVPPSVTSFGFGGHPGFHGVPPSVTSLHFGSTPTQIHRPLLNHRHHRTGFVNPAFGGVYYVPYALPYDYDYSDYSVMSPGVDDTMEEDYARPGPTVFDSHGVSGREYPRPRAEEDYRAERAPVPEPQNSIAEPPAPEEQPTTVLVFKDGRQMEVENYAIVGATLYDLSDGRSKKVALAELDLPATAKQNDDRGVEFKLPAGGKM